MRYGLLREDHDSKSGSALVELPTNTQPPLSLLDELKRVAHEAELETRRALEQRISTRVSLASQVVEKKAPVVRESAPRRQRKDTFDVQAMVSEALAKLSQLHLEVAEEAKKQQDEVEKKQLREKEAREVQEREKQAKVLAQQAEQAAQAEKDKRAKEDELAKEQERTKLEKAEQEDAKQQEMERLASAEREVMAARAKAEQLQEAQPETTIPDEISASALPEATRYAEALANAKSHRAQVQANKLLQQFCDVKKLRIRELIGQLTNGRSHVISICGEVLEILKTAKQHDVLAYEWVQDFLAKQVAKQAETEVSVSPAKAFPLARIVQKVSTEHHDFPIYFIGRLWKKCIYLIPKYCAQQPGETEKEFRRRIKHHDDEPEALYEERMSGMVSLFAAAIQPLPGMRANSELGMSAGWTWLARLLNMQPRKITPRLIYAFLTIAGSHFVSKYNTQALKLLGFLKQYIGLMPVSAISGATRLQVLLDEFQQIGHFAEPVGKAWDFDA